MSDTTSEISENPNTLAIPLDEKIKSSHYGVPCGGCQWLGWSPVIEKDGKCETCSRTATQIINDHGKLEVSDVEKEQRKDAMMVHMSGGDVIIYV